MKPKTKLQFQVLEHAYYVPNIEHEMEEWAKVSVLKHDGFATKNRVICMDCGQKFSTELVSRKRAICPHCNTKLNIVETRDRTAKQIVYLAKAEIHNGFQVIRNFEMISYHKADKPVRYFIWEVLQSWVLPNGKREVIARNHTLMWNVDCWNGNMEIRNKSLTNRYDIYPYAYHPKSVFQKEYRKIGINHKLKELTFLEALKYIPNEPYAETLLKAKQYSLLSSYRRYESSKIVAYWSAIKICMRNKYKVQDAKMWFDYLQLLDYFNKDLHNAHYVCPKDMKKAHDLLVVKKRKIQEKQAAQRKREKAIRDDAKFLELKKRFFGLAFKDELIEVKMLESVQEIMEEGDKMHHCVFTNEYYLKPDSIILSATIDNQKIETVEVSLSQLKVVQSRGVSNKVTEYHDRIVKLVNRNIRHIKKRNQLAAI